MNPTTKYQVGQAVKLAILSRRGAVKARLNRDNGSLSEYAWGLAHGAYVADLRVAKALACGSPFVNVSCYSTGQGIQVSCKNQLSTK